MTENLGDGSKVYMREGEYEFLVVRHKKFSWLEQEDQYIYFLYILRKKRRLSATGEIGVFNVLCHLQMFTTFPYLMKSLQPVLEEYVLEDQTIKDYICEVTELVNAEFELENDSIENLQRRFLASGE